MTPLLFRTPAEFADPAQYQRIGAIIKEVTTGQIAGHVQELGPSSLLSNIPIPGGNPLKLATEAVQMVQLQQIQQTLNTVQTLATVGAVASVATLGISAAGFAV